MLRRASIVFLALALPGSISFCTYVVPPYNVATKQSQTSLFLAKKSSAKASGQGFGKSAPEVTAQRANPEGGVPGGDASVLQSIEMGASGAMPAMPKKAKPDPSLPAQERTKQILREQFGLKSLEEQQTDAKKRDRMAQDRKRFEDLKKMAEKDDLDIMSALPAPLLIGIDRFLKAGVAVCTVLFIASGMGITAEAWSAATGNPLPEDVAAFIVTVIEPNFTPGLLVLLGFSVSLGIFASLQLGSAGATYREDK